MTINNHEKKFSRRRLMQGGVAAVDVDPGNDPDSPQHQHPAADLNIDRVGLIRGQCWVGGSVEADRYREALAWNLQESEQAAQEVVGVERHPEHVLQWLFGELHHHVEPGALLPAHVSVPVR